MTVLLRIKRRTTGSAGAPPSLANAELAYNEIDNTLYYGLGTGGPGGTAIAVVPIAGTGFMAGQGFITQNQVITISGDATGTGRTSIQVTLSPIVGLTPGAYSNITVNGKGQVTAIAALTTANITSALGAAALTAALFNAPNGVPLLDSSGKIGASQLPAALVGAVTYKGAWNPITNAPAITSGGMVAGSAAIAGSYYVATVAGTTAAIDGLTTWGAGDWIIFSGTTWEKLDGAANPVSSVNGSQGNVVVNATNLPGVGTMATQSAAAVAVTGGTLNGTVIGAVTPAPGTFTDLTITGACTLDGGVF